MFGRMLKFVFVISASSLMHANQNSHDLVSLVIFSYNRPAQLYAFLESVKKYVSGLGAVSVLYRTDSGRYQDAYEKVKKSFPGIAWYHQKNPPHDFKPLLLSILDSMSSEYVLFAVDDNIVKDSVDLSMCVRYLQTTNAYAFFLRLGENITYSYAERLLNPVPAHVDLNNEICAWQFYQGRFDWAYPNNVDMTVYRVVDVLPAFRNLLYQNPYTLEGSWASIGYDRRKLGLFFKTSKIVNVPVNVVSTSWANRYMHSYTVEELLEKFENNQKLDIAPLYQVRNTAAHMEHQFTFVLLE